MRILTDENIPREAVMRLRELGHDVETAIEAVGPDRLDAEIFHHARITDRVIVTRDKDFAEIVFTSTGPFPGVILIRLVLENRKRIVAALDQFMIVPPEMMNHLVVLEEGRYRSRRRIA